MSTVLIVGPCISEFGWELMEHQGHVRALAKRHDHVVVCSSAGNQPLYADLNPNYIEHNIKGDRDCHRMRKIENPSEFERVTQQLAALTQEFIRKGNKVVRFQSIPAGGKAIGPRRPIEQQCFIRFGKPVEQRSGIVIHARKRPDSFNTEHHNYPEAEWVNLLKQLRASGIETITAIGTHAQAIAPAGAVDMRGIPLQAVMDVMAASKLVIGPSSGPMHLASLCGTPHVVWTHGRVQSALMKRNRERYEQYWNPLKTPAYVIVHDIAEVVKPEVIASTVMRVLSAPA